MSESKKKYSQLHIQLLEPRIMFDGAAVYTASEAIDLLDDQQSSQTQSDPSQIISNVTFITDNPESRKEIVFIDSGVDDYQTIVDAIDSSKSIYLIDSNENGFTKMQSILQSQQEVDAVHIIGHASAGQVVLGNSILNADTINSFSSTLQSIGSALTQNGDLLFYGCNLAQGEQGKLLLQQIGNITQADIAASDDITGQGGDWELEHNYGIVETKGIEVVDFNSSLLQTGISSLNGFIENTGTNLRAGTNSITNSSNHSDGKPPYVIAYERTITSGTYDFYKVNNAGSPFEENDSGVRTSGPIITQNTTQVNAATTPLNVYYVYASESAGSGHVRSVTFDSEIVGVYFNMNNIIDQSGVSKAGATFHDQSEHGGGDNAYSTEKLIWEWGTNVTSNSKSNNKDWFGVDTDSNTLYVGFANSPSHGDIIRVFTQATGTNAPVARNDVGVVNEDATLTVSDGANKTATGDIDVNGEHSGDVINTSSTTHYDTDEDGDTLTVTAVRLGGTEGSGNAGSVGSALTGTYGQLTLNANGSYTYVANQAAADALDANDSVTDVFNYTVSDGTQTDTALITITVIGVNDDVVAVNDYGVVTENSSISITNGESQNLSGSYDAHDEHSGDISANDTDNDESPTHTITAIRTGSTEGQGTSGSLGSALDGTYGQLTLNANGSYTYAANKAAADALDAGETAYDYFNYTVSDGTDTDTGVIRISILGINDAPVAQNDEGVIVEAGTLTVANSANANETDDSGSTFNASGEHTGDIIHTSSSSHQDTDVDGDANLTVTAVQVGRENGALRSSQFNISYNSLHMLGNIGAHDIEFNSDGTKMFVAAYSRDTVREYALSTAFDLTTMSYTRELSLTTALHTNIQGLTFNNDGTKLFVIEVYGAIAEYHLTTGYDLSTASYDSLKQLPMTIGYQDINFNDDGTKMYTISWGDDRIRQYTLSTGFDVSTASSSYSSFYMGSQDSLPNGMTFTNNGSRLFVAGDNSNSVIEYSLSTAYDITTATHVGTRGVGSWTTAPESIAFNNAGTKMYVIEKINHHIKEFDIAMPFRLNPETGTVGTILRGTYGSLTLNSNGSYTYVADSSIVGLEANGSVIDYFNYTVSDGTATDTAELKITVLGQGNTAPVARNDVGVIAEDSTLSVSNGANANESGGSYNASGEYSGDVLHTSSTTHYDTDADGDTLTVASVRTGSVEGSGTAGTLGQALTGTYGQLTLNTNGSYTYAANQTAADALDLNDSVTDVFNYTVSDGNGGTDTATITITILGINDAPVAQDDVGVITAGSTLSVANSANANETNDSGSTFNASGEHSGDVIDTSSSSHTDSDADASASLSITQIRLSGGSNSAVSSGSTYNGSGGAAGTSVTGTYGTLTIGADGSYSYAATTDAAAALDSGESATDVFVYTLSDGTEITTANLTITVLGANAAPVARNDSGTVNEDATLTVSNSAGTSAVASVAYVQTATITAQESYPRDAVFNNDGTKMFVTGGNGDAVDEWTLSTAYDISTLSHVGNYSVATNGTETKPWGLSFNDDGTKMFVSGETTDKILEYHLSTPFTISSASYDSGFDLSGQDATISGHAFNNDGTKLFVIGNTNDAVFEYTLSTGFDVSTASYVDSFSISSQDDFARNIEFNKDGTKMFLSGAESDAILEYDLSTGFDVSTASYKGNVSVSTNSSAPSGITFNHDGTKVFIASRVSATGAGIVSEYNLTSPYNVVDVNGEHTGDVIDSSNTSTQDTDVDVETLTVTAVRKGSSEGSGTAGTVGQALTGTYGDLTLNADGSYTYVANHADTDALDSGDVVTDSFNYTVSDGTATDTAVITITVIGVNDAPTAQNDVGVIVEDGTLTVANGANANVSGSYDATGEYSGDLMDTSSSSHKDSDIDASDSLSITQIKKDGGSNSSVAEGSTYNGSGSSAGTSVTGTYGTLTIGADGSYTYVADQAAADPLDTGETANDVFVYTLFDGTATTTATLTITILGANDAPVAQNDTGTVNEDGTLTVSNGGNETTVTAAALDSSPLDVSIRANPYGLAFNDDGTKMFVFDAGADDIEQFTLSTAFDVSTASWTTRNQHPGGRDSDGRGLVFNNDGTKLFFVGQGYIYPYTLSTPYDVTQYSSLANLDIRSQDTNPRDIKFNNDGTKMFVLGGAGNDVNEYALSTAFDTSSASYSQNFSLSSQVSEPSSITFNNDGTKMFVVDSGTDDDINEYTLSTAFDVSTASYVGNFSIGSADNDPKGFVFNNDGTKMFVVGSTANEVNEYTLTSPFSLVNVTGEHTGDVIDSSNTSTQDTDVDVETLTVTAVRKGSSEGSGTAGTVGQALTGTYGDLTLNANGSYTYVANNANADPLDAGDVVTDSFNYTVSDGTATDTAVITITVIGINDTPVAQNDVGVIVEDGTLTVANGANANETDDSGTTFNATGEHSGDVIDTSSSSHTDSDADASASLSITQIKKDGGSNSAVASGSTYNGSGSSAGTSVTGTYGTLLIGADGSYRYIADQDAADALDVGDTANDVFVYTLSDGTATTTATLTITVLGANDAPVAANDYGAINENATLTVSDGDNQTVSGRYDVSGEHSGDVINTTWTGTDTDIDGDTLTVDSIRTGSTLGSGTAGTVGQALTGTYGQLTLNANGSYTYVANQAAAEALDAGDSETDTFNYTITDGALTASALIEIIVFGVNDTPVAQNDVGVILANQALNVTNGADANVTNTYDASGEHSGDIIDTSSSSHTDSDADASASLSITNIRVSGGSNQTVNSGSTWNGVGGSAGTSVTGTYGTLLIGADGSYRYIANQDAADALAASQTANDVFVYTLSDGTESTTANITITVIGINETPTAQNDEGVIYEGDTLIVANNSDANVSGSYDASGEHSGDVIDTSSSSHTDTDVDTNDTLTVTQIKKDGGSNSSVSSGSSYNSSGTSVTGTYGTLTIGADGSYKYVAQDNIAGFDAGETLTDTFTYTISDGTATATANIVITLLGDDGNTNNAPTAQNDVGVIVEDGTLTVANGANANETDDSGTTFNTTGEHSGDVMDTSSSSHTDSDTDGDTITVTQIKLSGGTNQSVTAGTTNTNGTQITGTYGTLTIGADGSYTYIADQAAADALDVNDSVTDVFVYTIQDDATTPATASATLTITILGANDTPTAVDDTDTVDEDGTVTKTGSQDDVLTDDSDPDDSGTLTVTAIQPSGGSSSNVTSGTTYTNGTSVTGTYGTLVIGADGSYTYTADQSAADDLDAGDTVTDVFTYTVTDENGATTTATITITVNGINDTPVAQNDVGVIVEDGTLTVANGANANETDDSGTTFNATGEHSGDVIDTSSSSHTDSDADDSASLSITQIKKNGGSDSAVSSGSSYNSNGTSVTGTYGTLTIGADGSYTYVADQTAADALDAGDSVTDVFVYTLSDGTATTTANITITVLGINDPPVAVDDTDTVDEDGTVTKTGSQDDVLTDDSDPDDSGTLTVTAIQPSGGSSSNVSSGTTYTNGTQSTGTYGTLTIGADGSYTYTADQDAADALDAGDTVTDVFTYTVTDENGETTTATITITVNGVNDTPVAQNDVGVIVEDGTLTVANGANANVTDTYDATGEHSGDVIDTSSSSHTDSDADASASLTITQIKKDGGSNSSVSSGSSYNSSGTSVTGTYGTLTIGADGSYTYVADQTAADALDSGDSVTDVFVYTLSDGTATTTANITITVLGANDDPVAVNDTDTVSAGATVTKTGSQDDVLTDDSDPDDSGTLTVTAIQPSGGSSSDVTSSSTYASNGTTVVGTYGTLIIGADGSYTYTADQSAADALDAGETADDVFTYTVTDENGATTTATLTITVSGSNDAPVARDDTGTVKEDATLTVSDGDNANAVSAATYVDGFSISNEEFTPQGFRFNNDGTKMFVIGSAGDDVNEYTLSTAFDVSTASFVDSFDISSQELGPRDVAFSNDGLKMFVVGVRGDDVNEYTLSTAFDVSTASFVDSFDISSQEDSPTGLAFNNDGTKMFVAGNAGDDINEYTLSTGFDVSTASFVDSFSVASQDTTPNGLSFNSDGTKMYVVGNQGNDINEYDLTLGFDVSTASFVGALDISSQDSAPKAVNFNNDGTKVFVLGTANKQVFEYTLDTPFSLINVNDEHSGDVIDTSSTSSQDTDADGDTLTVASVRTGNSEGSGTAGTVGSALTGTYGQLTLNANGSYTYVANQSAADDLDAGDVVYDYFNYTVSDGNGGTDIAVITITVIGINDTPVAVNDTDSVVEDGTVTKTGSEDDVLYDDTDVDDSHALTVTAITPSGGSTSTVTDGSTHSSGGTTVTGTYGTLVIGADGSYTYTADQDAADALDNGDTVTDVFTYTVSDGTNSTTATITITVTGINDTPVAQDDVGVIAEDSTLTVANGANANVTDSYDATGEHSGDVIDTSSSTHTDNDADDSASLTVTAVRLGSTEDAGSAGTVGQALTGTYGQLTLNADGSYTYAANQDAADPLDVGDVVYDYFNYTVSDGTVSDTALITITIIGINDTPTAVDDTDSVNEDERITVTGGQDDVLNDDTDIDADASLVVTNISHTNGNSDTVTSSTTHSNGTTIVGTYGTLTIGADGSYTYIADQDAADSIASGSSETDVFTYTISDGNGGTDTATLTITINGSDNEVVAVTDTGAVDAGSTLTKGVEGAGLISNDTDNGVNALSVGEATVTEIRTGRENRTGTDGTLGSTLVGTYGTLTLNADGTYTYTANTDAAKALEPLETAVDYFTYTLSDGTSTDKAELQITVTGINDPPTSTSPPQVNAVENQKIIIQTKTFFDDPDPKSTTYGQLTYTTSGLPSGLRINDAGRVVGRLPEGTYTFTVTATDGGGLSTQQTFTIVVGKPGKPGERPPKPIRINPKTIDDAVEDQVVVFTEEAPERPSLRMEALEVGSSLESIVKEYTFNGGMKVIDVAVEELNIDQSGRFGVQDSTILGFSIGDDYRLNVKQYTGTLEDGSSLPSWVKVDPATGQTIVQFPENVYAIDVKVIAIDKDNTTREINVTLDKNTVRQDQSLKRDLKPFVDRSAALKTEVQVDDRGQVFLNATNNGETDINRTQSLNSSDILNSEENTIDTNESDQPSTLKLTDIERQGDLFRLKISDENLNSNSKYSIQLPSQIDSPLAQLPSWIAIDRNTGEIQAKPPSNIDNITLELLAEDDDGNIRTLEIELDFTSDDLSLNMDQPQINEKIVEFASLQDQINLEFDGYENYGDKLTKATS